MCDHRRAAVELYESQPPRQALAEEKIVAVMEHRVGQELAFLRLRFPVEADRKALLAGLARRILHRAAVAALLQLEAPECRGGGESERDAAAPAGRQRRQPRPQDRVLALRAL